MAAKAARLAAIDAPFGDFKDLTGLNKSCQIAASLGYDGKWAIHPSQLETINAAFTPSDEDVNLARRILQAYKKAGATGEGAVALDGKMVDGGSIRLARNTFEKARKLGLVEESE